MNAIPNSPSYSIEFGQTVDKGTEEQKLFPYIYNFISTEDEYILSSTPAGVAVAANSRVDHPVRMDQDYHYMMLWARYAVFTSGSIVSPSQCFTNPAAPANWEYDVFNVQTNAGIPFLRDIAVSISIYGSETRFIYGGFNTDAHTQGGNVGILPLPIRAVQGYEWGIGQVRTPYFIPRSSVVMVSITNSSDNDYIVSGMLHGVKVRM